MPFAVNRSAVHHVVVDRRRRPFIPPAPSGAEGSKAEGSRRHSLSVVCLRRTLQFPPFLRFFVSLPAPKLVEG